MKNSVCYISKIREIKPIENADNIELALVEGWQCIVKKGEFKKDDNVILITEGAIIPEDLAQSFGIKKYLHKDNTVHVVKLKGIYSECLILPIDLIKDKIKDIDYRKDLSDILNIYKPKQEKIISDKKFLENNENFRIYYDIPNFKDVPNIFYKGESLQITRKIHGTNARFGIVRKNKISLKDLFRYYIKKDKWAFFEYMVGSHKKILNLKSNSKNNNVYIEISKRLKIKKKLFEYVKYNEDPNKLVNFIIYGEIYGKGIQNNYTYSLKTTNLFCFDVMINDSYIKPNKAKEIVKKLDLEYIPVLEDDHTYTSIDIIFDKYVKNAYFKNTRIPHEGVVVKSLDSVLPKYVKIKNPEFLIYTKSHNVSDYS